MHITSEQIRAERSAAGWEQSDLARASGVPLSSLKRLERRPGLYRLTGRETCKENEGTGTMR